MILDSIKSYLLIALIVAVALYSIKWFISDVYLYFKKGEPYKPFKFKNSLPNQLISLLSLTTGIWLLRQAVVYDNCVWWALLVVYSFISDSRRDKKNEIKN